MGQFLIVVGKEKGDHFAKELFGRGVSASNRLGFTSSSGEVQNELVRSIYFPRLNNSGSGIIKCNKSSSWLLTTGTWFHSSGLHAGDEASLLNFVQDKGLERLCEGIDGVFNIAYWDSQERQLKIITDVIGSCFSFYRKMAGNIAISNSSLLLAALDKPTLDMEACQEFLETGIIYGDKSLFKEVKRMPYASQITINRGEITSKVYWKIKDVQPDAIEGKSAVASFQEILTQCLGKVSSAFPRQVCDLTGGLDSRIILAGNLANGFKPDTTVAGENDSLDVVISKKIADMVGCQHKIYNPANSPSLDSLEKLLPITDGELNLFEYANVHRIHRDLSNDYDISINGSFGELARGYWWELLFPRTGKVEKLNTAMLSRKRFAVNNGVPDFFADYKLEPIAIRMKYELDKITAELHDKPNTFQMDASYLHMRMRSWQGRIASSTNKIWPCFSPLMFRSMLELLLSMSRTCKTRDKLYKDYFYNYNDKLGGCETSSGMSAMSSSTFNVYQNIQALSGKAVARARKYLYKNENRYVVRANLPLENVMLEEIFGFDGIMKSNLFSRNILEKIVSEQRTNGQYKEFLERLASLGVALKSINDC